MDSLRGRILAAFDPEGQFEDETHRRIEGLVRNGELAADEAERWIDLLLNYPSRWDVTHGVDEPASSPPPESSADSAELQALLEQLGRLEKELEELKQK